MNLKPSFKRSTFSLDITPLVDTVFNLMIFFALSMNFIASPGIKVKLPSASTSAPVEQRENLQVTIDAQGVVFINSKRVHDLNEKFKKLFATGKYRAVILKADEMTPHGDVVSVLDAARGAGFRVLAIATSPGKKNGR